MSALRGLGLSLLVAGLLAACGGGGSGGFIAGGGSSSSGGGSSSSGSSSSGGGSVNNVQPVSITLGPLGNYPNGIFTSVTICVPGTNNCQTLGNILVDTGSYGLRILGSQLNSGLNLPVQSNGSGQVGECVIYGDGYTWGPVANADIQIAGETASNVPINVFGTSTNFPNFPSTPPAVCGSHGVSEEDDLQTVGVYGILGVGPFPQDCGDGCTTDASNGDYFACGSGSTATCAGTTESEANQVVNPVVRFASDNNGVVIQLPSVSAGGATTSGSLIFGIGTQSNNGLGSAQVLTISTADNDSFSDIFTTFNGSGQIDAFIDSGSNALFFNDNSIAACASPNAGFYCPGSTLSLNANMIGANNTQVNVPFSIANANTLFNSGNSAFNDLGGSAGGTLSNDFDWGMPFFYGRTVYFAIYDLNAGGHTGPYYAY